MKRLLFPLLLLFGFVTAAQAQYVKVLSVAGQGGNTVLTSGITSTTKVEKTFPGATITVYSPTGSGTIASIFSASTGTVKANPFSASSTDATIDFFIAPGSTFDVRVSGVSGGVTITPFTRSGYTAPGTTGISLALCGNTAADTSLLAALNALGGTIEIPKSITCASNTQTISAALQVDNGGLLKPITGQTVTLTGAQIGGSWQRFTNATSGLGTISLSGNKHLYEIYSEWWGAIADGSTNCTGAINAAIASLTNNQPGLNGGIIRLLAGNYRTTGITITGQQIHIVGSGSAGDAGTTLTATTIISSITNATIIKYAYASSVYSYQARLEHLAIIGNSTGTSQNGVWVDNNGIQMHDVAISLIGGNGLLLSHSNVGDYNHIQIDRANIDNIRIQPSVSSLSGAAVQNNTFYHVSLSSVMTGKAGVHFLCGAGNMFFGLDIENEEGASRGVYFDHECPQEVQGNKIYGLWPENLTTDVEFAGQSTNNYVQNVRKQHELVVVANSTGIGNSYDSVPTTYGNPELHRIPRLIVGPDAAQYASAPEGLYLSDGNINLNNSTQRIRWGVSAAGVVSLAQIGVSSSTNVQVLDSAGTSAGSLTFGPATSSFPQLMRNGAGLDVKNGDNSAYGGMRALFLQTNPLTFATLPTSQEGRCVWITDSNTAVFNAIAAGGGVNRLAVCYDGTNWRVH